MSKPRSQNPLSRIQPLHWLLVVMAVVMLALATNPYASGCACDSRTADVLEVCEQNDHADFPGLTGGVTGVTPEPRPTWLVLPTEKVNPPDLDVEHPPPRHG